MGLLSRELACCSPGQGVFVPGWFGSCRESTAILLEKQPQGLWSTGTLAVTLPCWASLQIMASCGFRHAVDRARA